MTFFASSATRLPAAIARAAVLPFVPAPTSGRHTESEWSREMHDPQRDEVDAFDWLGFGRD
jgi:hypothetical protein